MNAHIPDFGIGSRPGGEAITTSDQKLDIQVRDDPDNHQYVATIDGVEAGRAVYHLRGGRHIFVHTETNPAIEGRGVGSTLARAALDDIAARGGQIVPLCPFIASFVKRHPEYQPLVDQELLDRINGNR